MTIKFTTTRAIGTAIALTISSAAIASAQTPTTGSDTTRRTTTGTRVTKDMGRTTTSGTAERKDQGSTTQTTTGTVEPAPAPMAPPAPAPSASMSTDSSMMSSTTSTSTTSTTTSTTTTESMGDMPGMRSNLRFGNGLYFGVQGGANFPQNEINNVYEAGVGAGAQLGWDPVSSPIGLRVNAMWNRLNGKDVADGPINNVMYRNVPNADLYSAFADAKVRLPFGRFLGATSGLYAVGGGGVTYFRNYADFSGGTGINTGNSVTNTFNPEDKTQFALNGGGGLSFGVGNVSLFVEGRYVRVFTQGPRTDYVPVTVGLTFH